MDGLVADDTVFVIIVSRGDISAILNRDRPVGAGGNLADRLMMLDASHVVRSVPPTDALVFMGHAGLGEGAGSFAISGQGSVTTNITLLDDYIRGSQTG